MNHTSKKPFIAAMGTAAVAALTSLPTQAADNPFAIRELASGYMLVAEADSAQKSPEMKCGAEVIKQNEGKCGQEGVCAGNKPMKQPEPPKAAEMACGEGKCGAAMQKTDAPQAAE